jgi:hypothetical protein
MGDLLWRGETEKQEAKQRKASEVEIMRTEPVVLGTGYGTQCSRCLFMLVA